MKLKRGVKVSDGVISCVVRLKQAGMIDINER